ncbi:hypothetical protein F5X96DRAFT_671627 [Biscogniauxia mediterranea]|nr:hypothetical protein F5X96DRAFT_671627 [Biscogniauxia mediterranea]
MLKVAVAGAGATGRVGLEVVKALLTGEDQVTVLTRGTNSEALPSTGGQDAVVSLLLPTALETS